MKHKEKTHTQIFRNKQEFLKTEETIQDLRDLGLKISSEMKVLIKEFETSKNKVSIKDFRKCIGHYFNYFERRLDEIPEISSENNEKAQDKQLLSHRSEVRPK